MFDDEPKKTRAFDLGKVPICKVQTKKDTKNTTPSPLCKSLKNGLISFVFSKFFGVIIFVFVGYILISLLSGQGPFKWSGAGCCHKWEEEEYVKSHLVEYIKAKKSGMDHEKILNSVFKVIHIFTCGFSPVLGTGSVLLITF